MTLEQHIGVRLFWGAAKSFQSLVSKSKEVRNLLVGLTPKHYPSSSEPVLSVNMPSPITKRGRWQDTPSPYFEQFSNVQKITRWA